MDNEELELDKEQERRPFDNPCEEDDYSEEGCP